MANLTYNYVYFASGPHTRQPRSSSGAGGFTSIDSFSGGTLSAGDTFASTLQPATRTVDGATYDFAFLSVSGGTGGGVVSTNANTPPPAVTVGSAAINVLVVYGPPSGGIGSGGVDGATIDSFDITTGALFNDTFVKVTPDASGSLTGSGNVEGWVPSATGPITIAALSPTSPTGVDFEYWLNLGTDGKSTSANLVVGKDGSVAALAFYQSPPQGTPPESSCQGALQYLQTIVRDGDKPAIPLAQFELLTRQLNACVAAGKLSQAEVTAAINAYLDGFRQPDPIKDPGFNPPSQSS